MLGLVPPAVEAIATSFGNVNKQVNDIAKSYEKGNWKEFFLGKDQPALAPKPREGAKGGVDVLNMTPGQLWNYLHGRSSSGAPSSLDGGRDTGAGAQSEIPQLQHGGIVTRPTLAMLGEHGPEAIVPLSMMPGALTGDQKGQENQKTVKDNTDQLKRLNDLLALLETGDIKLKMGGGADGRGGAEAGDGGGGARGGDGGGRAAGDGGGGRAGGGGDGDKTTEGAKPKRRLGDFVATSGGAPGGGTFPKIAQGAAAGAAESEAVYGRRRRALGGGGGGAVGGAGLTGGVGIPEGMRNQEVLGALNEVAGAHGVNPAAIAGVVKTESAWDPRAGTGSYHGLTQIGEETFREAGGTLGGKTWQQYLKASPADQIKVYGSWLEHYKFDQKLKDAGIDFKSLPVARQAAILQGFQFSPNKTDWLRAAGRGDLSVRATRSPQARALGDTSIVSMEQYYKGVYQKSAPSYAAGGGGGQQQPAVEAGGKRSLTHATEVSRSDGKDVPTDVLEEGANLVRGGGNQAQLKRFIEGQVNPQTGQHYQVNSAWCGDFAAAVITKAGGTPPKNPSWAMNWHEYGVHTETPQPGDILTRWKLSASGHGHVGVVKAYDPKTGMVTVEQGNTNAVYDQPLDRLKQTYEFRHGELRGKGRDPVKEEPYVPGALAAGRRAAAEAIGSRAIVRSSSAPAASASPPPDPEKIREQMRRDSSATGARPYDGRGRSATDPRGMPPKEFTEGDRKAIDEGSKKTVKVEGSAKVDVKVSDATAHPVGVHQRQFFKPNPPEHKAQMIPAQTGAVASATEAHSIAQGGTP
jgi:hypothetical protein